VTESFFGPLVSQWNVEQATIATLQVWIPEYLAEIERQNNFQRLTLPRPPAPESIHGGIDFDQWYQDTTPEVIVVVEPEGEPERPASAGYTQLYQIQVGVLRVGSGSTLAERPEDEARAVACFYGTACELLVQQPSLNGLTSDLVMVGLPRLSFPDPNKRAIVQVVTTFHAWVPEVIIDTAGPVQPRPAESPEYPGEPEQPYSDSPTVTDETVTLNATQI
jgi:hypothetical protein